MVDCRRGIGGGGDGGQICAASCENSLGVKGLGNSGFFGPEVSIKYQSRP